jgi:hypothetical protein
MNERIQQLEAWMKAKEDEHLEIRRRNILLLGLGF